MRCVNIVKSALLPVIVASLSGSNLPPIAAAAQTGLVITPAQSTIPLPRRKPPPPGKRGLFGLQRIKPPPLSGPGAARVQTDRRGQLQVTVPGIGRERDPDEAAQLKASSKSRWTQRDIDLAKQRCAVVMAATNIDADPLRPIGGAEGCGIAAPLKVRALGAVEVSPPAIMNCTLAAALYRWVVDDVQPLARKNFKQPVTSMKNISAYSCRSRRGVAGGRISEHSFGNALDIASFKLASGEEVDLLKHWNSKRLSFWREDPRRAFLTKIHKKSCDHFATSLGPEYNKAHANHFHVDLGRAGINKQCR